MTSVIINYSFKYLSRLKSCQKCLILKALVYPAPKQSPPLSLPVMYQVQKAQNVKIQKRWMIQWLMVKLDCHKKNI